MKRHLSIALQWLIVCVFVLGVVYALVRPMPPADYHPESWRSWDGFIALSYAGVGATADKRYASSKTLAEHLDALQDAGYEAITPGDVAAYMDGDHPLPEKAVLLLFESGRKDSFVRATPLLRQRGMRATLCVPTETTERWGRFYIKESEIRKGTEFSEWSFASMGHDAINPLPGGRFLVTRTETGGTPETDDEMKARLEKDYFSAAQLLERAVGHPITAYFYPFGDNGRGENSDPAAGRMNREIVKRFHRIAFAKADDPFNSRHRDPYELGYIRVTGNWSGDRVIEEIGKFLPVKLPEGDLLQSDYWSLTKGAAVQDATLGLPEDGLAWLRGTISWRDVDVTARITRRSSATLPSVYIRHTGPDSYVRVTLADGGARVQESVAAHLQTLAWHETSLPVDTPHEVRVRAKGNRLWVWLNGEMIAGAVPLATTTRLGRVGFGSQGGNAMVAFVTAKALTGRYVMAERLTDVPQEEQEGARAVMPGWFKPDEKPAVTDDRRDDLLAAAQVGIATIPIVRAPADTDPAEISRFIGAVDGALAHPVYRTLVRRLAVVEPSGTASAELKKLGWDLVYILNARDAADWNVSLAAGDMLLLRGDPERVDRALNHLLRTCPAEQVAVASSGQQPLPNGVQQVTVTSHDGSEVQQ